VGRRGVVRRRAVRAGRATFCYYFRAPFGRFLCFRGFCLFGDLRVSSECFPSKYCSIAQIAANRVILE
jgi:hypothetical protein